MNTKVWTGIMLLVAASASAADSNPKDEITAAAKKLSQATNYSWTANVDLGPNAQFTPGPTEGKTGQAGLLWLSVTFNDNTMEAASQGGKVAVKTEDGWKSGEEASADDGGGGFNPGRIMARRMQNLKAPATEVLDLLAKTQEIKHEGDTYRADLTEEGAKALATAGFGGRRGGGGQPPAPTHVKGSVQFWVKDGTLTKYQTKVSGKRVNRDGDEVDFERTTTVEIKDVDSTKIDLPEEAKKKLS